MTRRTLLARLTAFCSAMPLISRPRSFATGCAANPIMIKGMTGIPDYIFPTPQYVRWLCNRGVVEIDKSNPDLIRFL